MPTLDEIKVYLRVDFDEDDLLIEELARVADAYLRGAIGVNYPQDDPRARMLALLVISDLYGQRSLHESTKVSTNISRLADDLGLQLRLELRSNAQ